MVKNGKSNSYYRLEPLRIIIGFTLFFKVDYIMVFICIANNKRSISILLHFEYKVAALLQLFINNLYYLSI